MLSSLPKAGKLTAIVPFFVFHTAHPKQWDSLILLRKTMILALNSKSFPLVEQICCFVGHLRASVERLHFLFYFLVPTQDLVTPKLFPRVEDISKGDGNSE